MAVSSIHNGWRYDPANSRLDYYYRGTRVGHLNATGLFGALTITAATGLTATTGGVTATAGDITATAGNIVATAGDIRVTAGNVRLGAVAAFGTTEPTSAVVCKQGTEGAGAVATSSAIWSNATVLRKCIADGTVSNVG